MLKTVAALLVISGIPVGIAGATGVGAGLFFVGLTMFVVARLQE